MKNNLSCEVYTWLSSSCLLENVSRAGSTMFGSYSQLSAFLKHTLHEFSLDLKQRYYRVNKFRNTALCSYCDQRWYKENVQ